MLTSKTWWFLKAFFSQLIFVDFCMLILNGVVYLDRNSVETKKEKPEVEKAELKRMTREEEGQGVTGNPGPC